MRKLRIAILLAVTAASASAFAQDDAREKSDELFQEGARLYHAGKYSESILELKEGYRLAPHPVFLVNIALAYARLENWEEAARFGRQATDEEGLAPDPRAKTGARAEAWAVRHVAQSTAGAIASTPAPTPVATEQVVAPASRSPGPLTWTGLGGIGLGAIGITSAILIGAALGDERDDYEAAAARGDANEYARLGDIIDRRQGIGRILLYSGAGLMAVGGGLLVFDLLRTDSPVSAMVTHDGVAVRLQW